MKAQPTSISVCAAIALTSLSIQSTTNAVVVGTDYYSEAPLNNTAPTDDPGWDRIGISGVASGVYLGNGWVLTAKHTASTSFRINDKTYSAIAGSGKQLKNPEDNSLTDLYMYQINVPVTDALSNLPVVDIASSSPNIGSTGILMGIGYIQNSQTPDYDFKFGYPEYDSFTISTTERAKKWAYAQVLPTPIYDKPLQLNIRHTFNTVFDLTDESQTGNATQKDSGGAFFAKNANNDWELAGIINLIASDPSQEANTAANGNQTIYSDLTYFRDQILTTVPEPSSLLVLGGLIAPFMAYRRKA